MKLLWPRVMRSKLITRVNMRSATPMTALSAGTNDLYWKEVAKYNSSEHQKCCMDPTWSPMTQHNHLEKRSTTQRLSLLLVPQAKLTSYPHTTLHVALISHL